jgi:hypothetical protein
MLSSPRKDRNLLTNVEVNIPNQNIQIPVRRQARSGPGQTRRISVTSRFDRMSLEGAARNEPGAREWHLPVGRFSGGGEQVEGEKRELRFGSASEFWSWSGGD